MASEGLFDGGTADESASAEIGLDLALGRSRAGARKGKRDEVGPHRTFGQPLENIGNKTGRMLIAFNTGHYEAIDLSTWIAGASNNIQVGDALCRFQHLLRRAAAAV